jgi:predicted nucleic acid-binding protein
VLARVEVLRTVGRLENPTVTRGASELLGRVHLIRPDDAMLSAAAEVEPSTLRTFDSIHLATALSLRPNLAGIVVYDSRLAGAARAAGLTVFAPA